MVDTLRIIIASPPDRTHLVAEIWNEVGHIAEVNRENGPYRVEIYPTLSGEPHVVNLDEFTAAILKAKTTLEERR